MKEPINLTLWLMSVCVLGITGLQLFWNYQNYQRTVTNFKRDSNQALRQAVDQEMAQRRQRLIEQVQRWLADTSFIRITCDTNVRSGQTVFHINDRYPKFAGSMGESFSLNGFRPKLTRLTPQAKRYLIERFTNNTVRKDLLAGTVYYYTQRLGDSLTVYFAQSRVQLPALANCYRQTLLEHAIQTPFVLNPAGDQGEEFVTQPVNTAFRRPFARELVRARLTSPTRYFLANMKWLMLTTLALIGVCLACFGYTVKTLLSQHKLAQLKDNFIHNMTHELNTPLASIQLTTEALRSFAYEPPIQQEYLAIIQHQTQKLVHLTGRILQTNQLLNTPLRGQPLDLGALVTQAVAEMAIRFAHQRATLTYQPGVETHWIRGEAASLLTVMTNLLDNALKYTPENLALLITTETRRGWVIITFADNGPGIPVAYQTQVFEPFFRVPRGNVHDVKGYGLGLSYVRQVVHQHQGTVQVMSNQPAGSRFVLKLPLLS